MRSLLALCACTFVLTACESKVCTLKGCGDQLDVTFASPIAESGSYSIIVDADELTTECQVTLGPPGGLGGAGGLGGGSSKSALDAECSGSLGLSVEVLGTVRIEGLKIGGVWENVRVRLEAGDARLLDDSFEPNYVKQYPNGEQCPPVCSVASQQVPSEA